MAGKISRHDWRAQRNDKRHLQERDRISKMIKAAREIAFAYNIHAAPYKTPEERKQLGGFIRLELQKMGVIE